MHMSVYTEQPDNDLHQAFAEAVVAYILWRHENDIRAARMCTGTKCCGRSTSCPYIGHGAFSGSDDEYLLPLEEEPKIIFRRQALPISTICWRAKDLSGALPLVLADLLCNCVVDGMYIDRDYASAVETLLEAIQAEQYRIKVTPPPVDPSKCGCMAHVKAGGAT